MGRAGEKSKACAILSGVCAVTVWFDPTGISAATLVVTTAGANAGTTYHAGRKIHEGLVDRRGRAIDPQLVHRSEMTINRLCAAMTGCTIQATLSTVLPHCLFGLAINTVETAHYFKDLRNIVAEAGGVRALAEQASFRNMVIQAWTVIVIRCFTFALFLGTEVDTWISQMNETLGLFGQHALPSPGPESFGYLSGIIAAPVEAVQGYLGLEVGENLKWADNPAAVDVALPGATQAVVETAAAAGVEKAVHSLTPGTALRGNFSASSSSIQLHNHTVLVACCRPRRGAARSSRLDVNDYLMNDGGKFVWAKGGNFGASASQTRLVDGGRVLETELRNREGLWHTDWVRLDERIENNDGRLVFLD